VARRITKEKSSPYISLFERFFSLYKERPLFAIILTSLGFLVLAGGITIWNSHEMRQKKAWAVLAFSDSPSDLKAFSEEYKGTRAEPWILYRLAVASYSQGDLSEAISIYERLSREFPEHYLAAPALFIQGRIYEAQKDNVQARQVYAKLIEVKGDTFWAQKAQERLQVLKASTTEVTEG
jgi:tetratricopeptide (TPR) repeat protein